MQGGELVTFLLLLVAKLSLEENTLKADHFTDDRIEEIRSGRSSLTAEERAFLIADTPRHEECTYTEDDLAAMSDTELMDAAHGVWVDYVRCMY